MAVYTPLETIEIDRIARAYGLGAVRAHPIAEGVENTNYLLEGEGARHGGARHILTIYEKRMKTEELPFFIALMEHLAEQGLPVPRPLRRPDGEALTVLREVKRAAVVTFLDGASPATVTPAHLSALGRMLAAMHDAVADFTLHRSNDLSLAGWQRLAAGIGAGAERIAPGLAGRIAEEIAHLSACWPSHLPAGVVHADLFVDNVFFAGETLSGVIDFYFACHDAFLYDLAITLNAWCFTAEGGFRRDCAAAFLASYRAARPVAEEEWRWLPTLCRGAALRFLLTRAHDWLHRQEGALVTIKDPLEYDRILMFHRTIRDVSEYMP